MIERQYIYAYQEPLRYYPAEDRQARVQVTLIEEMNNSFYAIYATEEPGNYQVFDLQMKVLVHQFSLSASQRDFLKEQGMQNKHAYSFIYKVPLLGAKAITESSKSYTIYPSRPKILAAF